MDILEHELWADSTLISLRLSFCSVVWMAFSFQDPLVGESHCIAPPQEWLDATVAQTKEIPFPRSSQKHYPCWASAEPLAAFLSKVPAEREPE